MPPNALQCEQREIPSTRQKTRSSQRNFKGIPRYQCPECAFRIHDQVEMNAHCCLRHGEEYDTKCESFATKKDFYLWKAKMDKEQNTSWILGERHKYGPIAIICFVCSRLLKITFFEGHRFGNTPLSRPERSAHGRTLPAITTVVASAKRLAGSTYFSHPWFDPNHLDISLLFPIEPADLPADTTALVIADKVPSWALPELADYMSSMPTHLLCKVSPENGTSTLCTSYLKATFRGKVAVRYCTSHIGHDPLGTNVDSKSVSCQRPLPLTIPENSDLRQANHSLELPSPSYVFVTKKIENEVGSNNNSLGPSRTPNLKQSVPIKREVEIPIVLPSVPPGLNQPRNTSYITAAKVHVPETQDSWAEILNTALSDPLLSSHHKMLLQCLAASSRDLKNVIAMVSST
ncbi:hypothetical protein Y032_0011g1534 [Ancylostoma ceylanicum]|uniref:C2H2-type domain-containing protein n=1 Tax=Ancylostoma ceylanicum TaxID=53326 RepID=A0A016VH53_9BILA|nr:hypothetical protein Y032_0011g1534 [Ancylostoma ceylanicum]